MKTYRYVMLALLSFALVACGQMKSAETKGVAYVETSSSSSAMSQSHEHGDGHDQEGEDDHEDEGNKSPEQVAAEEGNHAEQIVVKITADGYVTSHGDHYHFYNGQVGHDALFSKNLLVAADYVFDPSHVVAEVADGHVIKIGEDYRLYVTVDQPINLRD